MATFALTAMQNAWVHIPTDAELEARHAVTASLDPRFAREDRKFWESRTEPQLRVLKREAWDANDSGAYQTARAYLVKLGVQPWEA